MVCFIEDEVGVEKVNEYSWRVTAGAFDLLIGVFRVDVEA